MGVQRRERGQQDAGGHHHGEKPPFGAVGHAAAQAHEHHGQGRQHEGERLIGTGSADACLRAGSSCSQRRQQTCCHGGQKPCGEEFGQAEAAGDHRGPPTARQCAPVVQHDAAQRGKAQHEEGGHARRVPVASHQRAGNGTAHKRPPFQQHGEPRLRRSPPPPGASAWRACPSRADGARRTHTTSTEANAQDSATKATYTAVATPEWRGTTEAP